MGYRRMGALQQKLWENRISSTVCPMYPTPTWQYKPVCSYQVLQQRPSRGQEALQPGALPSTVENRTLVTGQSPAGGLKQLISYNAGEKILVFILCFLFKCLETINWCLHGGCVASAAINATESELDGEMVAVKQPVKPPCSDAGWSRPREPCKVSVSGKPTSTCCLLCSQSITSVRSWAFHTFHPWLTHCVCRKRSATAHSLFLAQVFTKAMRSSTYSYLQTFTVV